MSGSSDLGEIEEIGANVVSELIGTMHCSVNLLPEFQIEVLRQFTSARKGTQHLLALTEPGEANPSGVILYGVVEGRRRRTLSCRLLLVSDQTKTEVAKALINHGIAEHTADRVEAQVINHDPNADIWP